MSNFRKAGKYQEWNFQRIVPKVKNQKKVKDITNEEKEVNININLSTLVYMFAVMYWCNYTEMSTNSIITSIVVLFILDIVINTFKQILE